MRSQYKDELDEAAQYKLATFINKLGINATRIMWTISLSGMSRKIQADYGRPDQLIMSQATFDGLNAMLDKKDDK